LPPLSSVRRNPSQGRARDRLWIGVGGLARPVGWSVYTASATRRTAGSCPTATVPVRNIDCFLRNAVDRQQQQQQQNRKQKELLSRTRSVCVVVVVAIVHGRLSVQSGRQAAVRRLA